MSDKEERDVVWVVYCHNEWCSGPPTVAVLDTRPDDPYPCPVCGWPAMHVGGGIKRIRHSAVEEEECK